jgi:hypothetical protein
MAWNQVDTPCFLCGTAAACGDTDHGNRKFYQCSAEDCGDYEISVAAIRKLKGATSHRQQLKRVAHGHRGADTFVEIFVGADTLVVATAVKRYSGRRR